MGTSVTGHTQPPVIDLRKVTKTYGVGETLVKAVRGIDLTVHTGDYVAVMGASGSGKSTLMNVLGCLDTPTTGHYFLDGLDVADMDEHALALVRNRRIGFIFQAFNLIPRTTALANVEIPMAYARVPRAERRERAQAALELVGMADAAIETADVVIQTDEPSKVATAIAIGRMTRRVVWQNIGFAFGVKLIVLALGAGGLATMWEAVFADVGVAFLAILNAVRIQRMTF